MGMTAVVTVFFCFIFFKGMSPLLLDGSMTVLAALIMAIIVTACIIAGGTIIGLAAMDWIERRVTDARATPSARMYLAPVATTVVAIPLSYFVLIGFSPRLARRVDLVRDFGDFHPYSMAWFWFCVMVAIPVVTFQMIRIRQIRRMMAQ